MSTNTASTDTGDAVLSESHKSLEALKEIALAKSASVLVEKPISEVASVDTYHKAITRFQESLSLTGYTKKTHWKPQHDTTLVEFFSSKESRKLVAFMREDESKNNLLCLQNGLPSAPITEMMYFIKLSTSDESLIDDVNFEQRVQYGTLTGDAMASLLRLMQSVYLPLFLTNKNWPDSIRKEFNSQLHRFMAFLTDTTFQLKGHTVLYVPNEDLSNLERAAKTKDLVQRLESLLVHWTRQSKCTVKSNTDTRSSQGSHQLSTYD